MKNPSGSGYVVHVIKKGGSEAHVLVSASFEVTGVETGGPGAGGPPPAGSPSSGSLPSGSPS